MPVEPGAPILSCDLSEERQTASSVRQYLHPEGGGGCQVMFQGGAGWVRGRGVPVPIDPRDYAWIKAGTVPHTVSIQFPKVSCLIFNLQVMENRLGMQ